VADNKPILAIDFDGTIVEHEFPEIGKEIPGALQTLKQLKAVGCHLILWTCREGKPLSDAVLWLRKNGVEFDVYNQNFNPAPDFNPKKVYADIYFDDRNFKPLDGPMDAMMWTQLLAKALGMTNGTKKIHTR